MSQENVEIVREMYGAFNPGDVEQALKLLHPQAELRQPPELVDAEPYIGLDAFVRGMTQFTREWHNPRFEPQDVNSVGNCVLMRVRVSGRGNRSGVEITTDLFHVWTFKDRKAHKCFVCYTPAEALEAVGLEDG